MASEKLLDTMKIKEKKFFHAKMTTYSKWGCIGLLKSKLTERQQQQIRATCFGHFLDVNEMCFTGQFCHHILLRECHVDNAENEMWSIFASSAVYVLGIQSSLLYRKMICVEFGRNILRERKR
ncbi:hypothetical protein ACOSQ3_013304 [Xanthoceras sorbifolium]